MALQSKPRFTIGQVMVVIAAFACLLAIPSTVRLPNGPALAILAGWLALMSVLMIALHLLIGIVIGFPCPSCSRWTLRRIARHPRYYHCGSCRARFKHAAFGPWIDASGPEHEARFRKPSDAGTWRGFEVPEHLEGSTTGELLRDKRSGKWHQPVPRPAGITDRGRWMNEAKRRVRRFLIRIHEEDDLPETG
jgi:hypothetical protein